MGVGVVERRIVAVKLAGSTGNMILFQLVLPVLVYIFCSIV